MSNSFDLIVYYQDQKNTFHIGTELQSLQDVRESIGQAFNIDINLFIIEILDTTYNSYITLDKWYFEDLRSDSSLTENQTITARLRSQDQTAYSMVYDDCQISTERGVNADEFQANHVVIWLDRYIGQPGNCDMLKHQLSNIIESNEQQEDSDIDTLIALDNQLLFTSLIYPNGKLYAFSEIDQCMKFIYEISEKRHAIYIIVDEFVLPLLLPQIFDNIYIRKIYVLVSSLYTRWTHFAEVFDYLDKVMVFDHEADLFSRLLRDIARYYVDRASYKSQQTHSRLLFLNWAKDFYEKADRIDQRPYPFSELKVIENEIHNIEDLCKNDCV